MKTSERITLTVAFLAAVLTTTTYAQSWETVATVDDNINPSFYPKIAAAPSGLLLATVTHVEGQGPGAPRLYASNDRGVTWERMPDDSSGFHPDQIVFNKAGDAVAIAWELPQQLAKSSNGGRNWTIANTPDFTPAGVGRGVTDALTVNPSGRIWVVGYNAAGGGRVLVSSDGGTTWTPGGPMPEGNFRTIAVSSTAVVVSGANSAGWASWRSVDDGATWTQVDTFKLSTADLTYARSAAADSQGRFYVAGAAKAPIAGPFRWIVRGSTNGGLTWTTLDSFYEDLNNSYAIAVTVTPQGRVFVIGYSLKSIAGSPWEAPRWRVRASSNGGQTWQTVDEIPPAGDPTVAPTIADAYDVASDSSGNTFVIGSYAVGYTGPNSVPRAIVRRLPGPPLLTTSIQQGLLQLAWPTNSAGFVLQSATNLTNGGSWRSSSLTPTITNGQKVVSVYPTSPAAFFRLRKP